MIIGGFNEHIFIWRSKIHLHILYEIYNKYIRIYIYNVYFLKSTCSRVLFTNQYFTKQETTVGYKLKTKQNKTGIQAGATSMVGRGWWHDRIRLEKKHSDLLWKFY